MFRIMCGCSGVGVGVLVCVHVIFIRCGFSGVGAGVQDWS